LQANWGDIVEIGIRATTIRTTDNIIVIIPNNEIMRRDIINYTASGDSIRLRIPIGIAYDANVELAKKLCLQAADECEYVTEKPVAVCILRSFGASSVDLQLRVWLHDARRRRDAEDWLTERVKGLFDEFGIEIPYPKRDLYIKQAPGGVAPWSTPNQEPDDD
jgi:small-conductance mechanosensitive channel